MTVWAQDATSADAWSTALFVLGPEEGLRLARRTAGLEALFLVRAGDLLRVKLTPGLRQRVRTRDGALLFDSAPPTP